MPRRKAEPKNDLRGRKHGDAAVSARREEIDRALRTCAWSLNMARKIADKHGVGLRQVFQDAAAARQAWRDEVPRDPIGAKADTLGPLREAQRIAFEDRDVGRLTGLLRLRADVTGAMAPLQVQVAVAQVEALSVEERARVVLDALPEACQVLGIPAPEMVVPAPRQIVEIKD